MKGKFSNFVAFLLIFTIIFSAGFGLSGGRMALAEDVDIDEDIPFEEAGEEDVGETEEEELQEESEEEIMEEDEEVFLEESEEEIMEEDEEVFLEESEEVEEVLETGFDIGIMAINTDGYYELDLDGMVVPTTLDDKSINTHTMPTDLWAEGEIVYVSVESTHLIDYMELNGVRNFGKDEYGVGPDIYVGGEKLDRPDLQGNTGDRHWTVLKFNLADLGLLSNEGSIPFYIRSKAGRGHDVGGEDSSIIIEIPTIDVTGNKTWQGGDSRPTIDLQLMRKTAGGELELVDTQTLNGSGDNWSYTWNEMPKYNPVGQLYTYSVDEADVPEDYIKTLEGLIILNRYSPDTIGVDKNADRLLGFCRLFEVTLDITGTPPTDKPLDVVLVIDTSTSMNTGGRMAAARAAASTFADYVLGEGNPNGNRISIVNYGTRAHHSLGWSSSLTQVKNSINGLGPSGTQYTNIHEGFIYAEERIDEARDNANKVIVMMSDGGANRYMSGSSLRTTTNYPTSHNNSTIAAYGKGQELQDKANIFTVGLFTGMPNNQKIIATETLLWSAPDGQYYEAPTPAELEGIYQQIAEKVNYSATDAVVVDKIGDNFNLIEDSLPEGASYNPNTREITWNIGTIGTSAQLKYQIRPIAGFEGEADTNEYANLTYTDINGVEGKTKAFPVPRVTVAPPLTLSLGDDLYINLGETATLGLDMDIQGGDGNGNYTYEWRIKGESQVISTDRNPQVNPLVDTEYELTIVDSNGCMAVASMTVFVNQNIGAISISKEVEDDLDVDLAETEFEIKVSGPNGYEETFKLKPGESKKLTGLALGEYTVEEINIDVNFRLVGITENDTFTLTMNSPSIEIVVNNQLNHHRFGIFKFDEETGLGLDEADFVLKLGDEVIGTYTTKGLGYALLENLLPGTYTLQETKAPIGYNFDDTIYEITINVDGSITVDQGLEIDDEGVYPIIKISNIQAPRLPDTGGIGSLIFTVIGITLMLGAYVFYRRRQA